MHWVWIGLAVVAASAFFAFVWVTK